MKIEIEYGFNNRPMSRFEEYELKVIDGIKYVVAKPYKENEYLTTLLDFKDYEENDKPLIDFINLGKLSLDNKEDTDELLIEYVNKYGFLGLIHDLPINRYYTLDKKVVLKEYNGVTGEEHYDCIYPLDIMDYFKIFFPTASNEEIKKIIDETNKMCAYEYTMEKFIISDLNDLYFENKKYYERADVIINYAQTLYKTLQEFKKNPEEYHDDQVIERVESNHAKIHLNSRGIVIHIRSLKDYIDEVFRLYILEERKYLKICKHCGKAFIAPNPKTEYDTFSCKNQENVYKSRARLSSNVTRTEDGITVKNIISEELSNEIANVLKKNKK